MSAHAWLSPSAAEAWSACPAYPSLVEGLPRKSAFYSAEGTFAHDIADTCLTLGLEPWHFIGHHRSVDGFLIRCDREMADYLQFGIDRIREFGGHFFGERKVSIAKWTIPGQFGTLDRGVVTDDLIVIGDLKYGAGVTVDVERNKQMMLYALGFWWDVARHYTKATRFLLIVDQPRVTGQGGEWETTLDELLDFGEWIKGRAALTQKRNPPRGASEKGCFWCPLRRSAEGCDTWDEFSLSRLDLDVEDLDDDIMLGRPNDILKQPWQLTPERRAFLAEHKGVIIEWLNDNHTRVLRDAIHGKSHASVKAVLGSAGQRFYTDKDAAAEALSDILGGEAFVKMLISPAQAEKIMGKDRFAKRIGRYVDRPSPRPKLVPASNAKPAYLSGEADDSMFEDLGDDDEE